MAEHSTSKPNIGGGIAPDVEGRALWARMQQDDPGAFDAFVNTYRDRAMGLALKILRVREEAEDVVQEAFLRLWRTWRAGKIRETPKGVLFRTVLNLAKTRIRRGGGIATLAIDDCGADDALALASDAPTPEEVITLAQEARLARECLDEVISRETPHDRRIIEMLWEQEMKPAEIASALGTSEGYVRKVNCLFKKRMRAALLRSKAADRGAKEERQP